MKKLIKTFFLIFFILIFFIILINFYVLSFSKKDYYKQVKNLPNIEYGLVFGASVKKNLFPSDILKDRLLVAYFAYKNKKIKKIIVSGSSEKNYNEPNVMKNYLVKLGVNKKDIIKDNMGFDTYDSLYILKTKFKVKKVILFTQDFHLKRALYIGKKLGVKVYGIETNKHKYKKEFFYNVREIGARLKAFFEVEVLKRN